MKKQIAKLSLKTDQIISLSKASALQLQGGMMRDKSGQIGCRSVTCTPSGPGCWTP
ncbi:class I lanthipeptide [Spirosoma sp. BT702]|uniref:Class I lanthipeptide n=1 Tax=Spirosoma profusum TaxID=2771354 RepID=A0A926XU79_9BACT|nr:class I lanthipeptide [Spirosoma profusum]MBD2699541.1 class I lanthipeptide [Spirosoma profusum]